MLKENRILAYSCCFFNFIRSSKSRQLKLTKGFTTIELVLVIILLALLAVNIIPKFMSAKGFEEYSYQSEVVGVLRAIQLKAMQQTDGSKSHTIAITTTRLGLLNGKACGSAETTNVCLESDHNLAFDTRINQFSFNSLGVPLGDCLNGCTITIVGSEKRQVKIESQGYIHAL